MGGIIRRTSISLPDDLLVRAKCLAGMRRRNFSNYVADLIASDIAASADALPPELHLTPEEREALSPGSTDEKR